ncbi:MAG: hypothetical protein NTX50_10020 [Candidatus Sumerlaeota bacterium]|nr:hypothetical protein [Candidatus Sumerlaeota bacterium]
MSNSSLTIERWAWIPSAQENPEFFPGASLEQRAEFIRKNAVRALLWTFEKETWDAVQSLHRATGVPVCPVVPNMATYARDTRDKGLAGAALDRLLSLPVADIARICLGAIPAAPDVLKKDFATGVCLLAEMELARFRKLKPLAVFLHSQMTDLAMAFDNARLFAKFIALVRRRYGVAAGIATNNFGHLAPKLRRWSLAPDYLIAPFNPKGYLMYPDRAACETSAQDWREALIASRIHADGAVAAMEAEEYLASLQLKRAIIPFEP